MSPLLLAVLAPGIASCSLFDRSREGSGSGAGSASPVAAAPAPAPAVTRAAYAMNRVSDGDTDVVIRRVTIEPTVTKIEMSCSNSAKKPTDIMLAPPGDPEVMFLELPGGKRASLKSAEGIAIMPSRTSLAAGETKTFTISFEPIPADTKSFDLFEGEQGKTAKIGSGSLWVFRNVELK